MRALEPGVVMAGLGAIPEDSELGRQILAALADGRATDRTRTDTGIPVSEPEPDEAAPELVAPAVAITATFTVPVVTKSEANSREWRERAKRTKAAAAAVAGLLGRHLPALAAFSTHYHAGGALDVVLTRMGGRRLDAMANLGASLKATEDAVCRLLAVDDGDPRWRCRAEQEPGGPVGVRVQLTTA